MDSKRLFFLLFLLAAHAHGQLVSLIGSHRATASSGTGTSIVIVSSTYNALGLNGGTTSTVNATGATGAAVFVSYYTTATVSVSDAAGDTFTAQPAYTDAGSGAARWFTCSNLNSPGGAFTVTVSGASSYSSATLVTFKNNATSGMVDNTAGANNASSNTIQPGSLTPSASGELYLIGIENGDVSSSTSFSNGITGLGTAQGLGGTYYGEGAGYLIQTGVTALNPTVTNPTAGSSGMSVAAINIKHS